MELHQIQYLCAVVKTAETQALRPLAQSLFVGVYPSSVSAQRLSCSMMGMCCGQARSH